MEGRLRVSGQRHTGRFLCALLATALTGCAPQMEVVHDEPRAVAESENLVVESSARNDGKLVLQVFREHEIVTEQTYWRQRKASPAESRLLTAAFPAPLRVASINWFELLRPEAVYMVFVAGYYAVKAAVTGLSELASMTQYLLSLGPFDEQRTVARIATTSRQRSYSATIERADGSGCVILGKQPDEGYVLDSNTIDLFGGPGDVVVRDGELSAHFNLERPR